MINTAHRFSKWLIGCTIVVVIFIMGIQAGLLILYWAMPPIGRMIVTRTVIVPGTSSTSTMAMTDVTDGLMVNLRPYQLVGNRLELSGTASGGWFFEGSFPITVITADGAPVAHGFAQARGEWMTNGPVAFTSSLDLSQAVGGMGYVLFNNDNASAMPEHSHGRAIPIRFTPTVGADENMMVVKSYFANKAWDPEVADCTAVAPVARFVEKSPNVASVAMIQLLKGPTPSESKEGYYSSIPDNVIVKKLTISNSVATIDLGGNITSITGGSCIVGMIRAQIEQTLKQFPTVSRVEILVNGSADGLQP